MLYDNHFFATDVHGSDICWKKFINAGKFYKAEVLILGGDMTGKAIIPLIKQVNGSYKVTTRERIMPILDDVEEEALRIIDEAQQWGILLRLIGGLAIKLHSPSASHRALERQYSDIDFVASKHGKDKLPGLLISLNYEPNKTFNTLSGDRRQLYYDLERDRQIDIFIEHFEMCHRLPVGERLDVEPITIPLAELFLTKAQIVQMNEKDIRDICALLLDHEVGPGDEEMINSARIAELCARDWGLWKTISLSMDKVEGFPDRFSLEPSEAERIESRLEAIKRTIVQAPKSMAWRMRDKLGTRMRWYKLPEEVQRTQIDKGRKVWYAFDMPGIYQLPGPTPLTSSPFTVLRKRSGVRLEGSS